jgi:uncharacterized cupredoxin-like copper-binding protein
MRFSRLGLIPLASLLLVACSSGGSEGAASTSTAPAASAVSTRIEVTLSDALRLEPATMTVRAGVPVTFVVTNAGVLEHEFYLGDENAQAEHEEEMTLAGGMRHDEPEGFAVDPGETRELTYTFAKAGTTMAGCHVAGHYLAGMKAEITVVE